MHQRHDAAAILRSHPAYTGTNLHLLWLLSGSAEPDVVGVEAADRVPSEGEHLGEDELTAVAILVSDAACAGRNDAVALLDQAVDGDRRAALEAVALNLGVEGVLAVNCLVAM